MKDKKTWLWEFSKKIMWIVTILFVAVFIFSCGLLTFYPDSSSVQTVIENISDVFKVTVVCYAVKAGFENVFKISKKRRDVYENCNRELGDDIGPDSSDSGTD